MRWILITLLIINVVFSSFAQPVYLIQPTGSGGFESGSTFSANGWNTVLPSTQYWRIGTAASGYSGSRGVYWGTSTSCTYTTTTSRTGHFYRDVVIPTTASNVTLSWSMKGNGQINFDRLLVYIAPTSVTPVANVPVSPSTTISGASLIYTQSAFFSSYLTQSVLLSGVAGTTVRLIFTWQNNATSGTLPPIAIDNISLSYVSTICLGMPSAGTVSSSVSSGCTPYYSNLTLVGATSSIGITYQWQKSIDNFTWSDISGETSSYCYTYVAASAYYRCKVTCSNSGQTSYAPSVLLSVSAPVSISGVDTSCLGYYSTLTGLPSGGIWTSSNSSVATVSSLGTLSPVTVGTTVITYLFAGCYGTKTVRIVPLPSTIVGPSTICEFDSATFTSSPIGGMWSSSAPGIFTVNSAGRAVGISTGNATITYKFSGFCRSVKPITIKQSPDTIAGVGSICSGSSMSYTSLTIGGSWISSDTIVGIVNSVGTFTAISSGNTVISYVLPNGCGVSRAVTVNILPSSILGDSVICENETVFVSSYPSGGTWKSSDTEIAKVNGFGTVEGISSGTAQITYELPTGCRATEVVTVLPSPSSITGPNSICKGSMTVLSCGTIGGIWSSSNVATASVSSLGNVSGLNAGDIMISYTLSNNCYSTHSFAVYDLPKPIINSSIYGPSLFVAPYSSHEWRLNGSIIPFSGMNIIYPTVPGNYSVRVTDSNGCQDTALGYQVLPDWLIAKDLCAFDYTDIFPNPVSDFVYVKTILGSYLISVSDLNGREVSQLQNKSIIDLRSLAPGNYILTIFDENRKLIKIKYISKIN
jgi:hypothetical protein